jgi:hypothetical protein
MVSRSRVDGALEVLAAVVNGDDRAALASVETFAITRENGDEPQLFRVRLDPSLEDEFRDAIRDKVGELIDLTPREYAPAAERSPGEFMYVSADDPPLLATIEGDVDTGDAPLFDPRTNEADGLRLFVTRVTLSGGPSITFYRELRPTAVLDRSRFFAAAWSNGRYNKIRTENTLLFDRKFDAVVIDGVALFTSKATFERIFDFLQEVRRNAVETYDMVIDGLRIDGAPRLYEACTTDPNMMAKMASIRRKLESDPAYRDAMTMPKIVAYVRNNPATGVEITGSGPSATLVFHADPRRRWKILRLLDDDYLSSVLTSHTYEANSKSAPLS